MNKKELISAVSAKTGLSKATCETVMVGLARATAQALSARDEITLIGIGKLSTQATKERSGKNPSTGEMMTIPAGTRIKFKALKAMKDAVL